MHRGAGSLMNWNFWKRFEYRACFRLARARLCLDCDVIFEAEQCPVCGARSFVPVTRWIPPLPARQEWEQGRTQSV